MTERAKVLWRVAAVVFTTVNLVGLGMAMAAGEDMHSALHVVLSLAGGAAVWWLGRRQGYVEPASGELSAARLEQLQQSVDAVALEVERIGEAQRFHAKLQSEQSETAR